MQRPATTSQRYYRNEEVDDSRYAYSNDIAVAPGPNGWQCTLDDCGKIFPEQRDLIRHMRTVKKHQEPSYACSECASTFTRKDALSRHCKSKHGHDGAAFTPMSPHPSARESEDLHPTRYRFVEPVVSGRSGSSPTPSLSSNGYSSSSSSDSSPPQYPRRLAPEDPRGRGPQYDQAGPGFPWIYNARMDVNPASYETVRAGERPRLPPLRSLELPTVGKRH